MDNIKEETLNFHDTSTILNEIKNLKNLKLMIPQSLITKASLIFSILNLIVSLIIFILFDFSNNQFQFVQEHYNIKLFMMYI